MLLLLFPWLLMILSYCCWWKHSCAPQKKSLQKSPLDFLLYKAISFPVPPLMSTFFFCSGTCISVAQAGLWLSIFQTLQWMSQGPWTNHSKMCATTETTLMAERTQWSLGTSTLQGTTFCTLFSPLCRSKCCTTSTWDVFCPSWKLRIRHWFLPWLLWLLNFATQSDHTVNSERILKSHS